MDYNKLLVVVQHFRSNGHDFNRHENLTLIERMFLKKTHNIMVIAETHEDKSKKHIQTLIDPTS